MIVCTVLYNDIVIDDTYSRTITFLVRVQQTDKTTFAYYGDISYKRFGGVVIKGSSAALRFRELDVRMLLSKARKWGVEMVESCAVVASVRDSARLAGAIGNFRAASSVACFSSRNIWYQES